MNTKDLLLSKTLYVTAKPNRWYNPESTVADEQEPFNFSITDFEMTWDKEAIPVHKFEVEVTLPEVELSLKVIDNLEEELEELATNYYEKKAKLEGKIADLKCITYEGDAA